MTAAEKIEKIAQLEQWLQIAVDKEAAAERLLRTARGRDRRAAYAARDEQSWRIRSFRQQLGQARLVRTEG